MRNIPSVSKKKFLKPLEPCDLLLHPDLLIVSVTLLSMKHLTFDPYIYLVLSKPSQSCLSECHE